MTTYTELLEPTKGERHGAFTWRTEGRADVGPRAGVLTIMGARCYGVFHVEEFACDLGRGFMLFKRTPGTDRTESRYAVHVSHDGDGQCECRGFVAYGRCKHVACITELLKAARL